MEELARLQRAMLGPEQIDEMGKMREMNIKLHIKQRELMENPMTPNEEEATINETAVDLFDRFDAEDTAGMFDMLMAENKRLVRDNFRMTHMKLRRDRAKKAHQAKIKASMKG